MANRQATANRPTVDLMATTAAAKPTSPTSVDAAAGAVQKPAKPGGRKPDMATISGIALAAAGIIGGLLLEKGNIQDLTQFTAAMIVFGGTFGAVLVTMPMATVVRAFRGLSAVFFEAASDTSATIDSLVQYATKARKQGIVSLEAEAAAITDPYLRKALSLAVDGTDLQELRKMMEIDIALAEHTAEGDAKVWEAAGGYAPTIGIIGAVMGLIQVMKHLEDIKEVGHGIAVAFVATVYGVASANILFLPAAAKLRMRMSEATLRKDMILEGIIGIVEGLNPTLIRLKLDAYDPHRDVKKAPTPKPAAAPAPGARAKRPAPLDVASAKP
jgi:chemotaxis protein MotA